MIRGYFFFLSKVYMIFGGFVLEAFFLVRWWVVLFAFLLLFFGIAFGSFFLYSLCTFRLPLGVFLVIIYLSFYL